MSELRGNSWSGKGRSWEEGCEDWKLDLNETDRRESESKEVELCAAAGEDGGRQGLGRSRSQQSSRPDLDRSFGSAGRREKREKRGRGRRMEEEGRFLPESHERCSIERESKPWTRRLIRRKKY